MKEYKDYFTGFILNRNKGSNSQQQQEDWNISITSSNDNPVTFELNKNIKNLTVSYPEGYSLVKCKIINNTSPSVNFNISYFDKYTYWEEKLFYSTQEGIIFFPAREKRISTPSGGQTFQQKAIKQSAIFISPVLSPATDGKELILTSAILKNPNTGEEKNIIINCCFQKSILPSTNKPKYLFYFNTDNNILVNQNTSLYEDNIIELSFAFSDQ